MDFEISTPHGVVLIRQGKEDDAGQFRALRLEALSNHPEAYSMDYSEYLSKPSSFWIEKLGDAKGTIYVAVVSDQLIGMSGINRMDSSKVRHSADLWGVYVRPDWRGFHISEGLTNACVDWARTQSIGVLKLGAVTTNILAIRSYARCGFKVYGIEPQAIYHSGAFYDMLLMARYV